MPVRRIEVLWQRHLASGLTGAESLSERFKLGTELRETLMDDAVRDALDAGCDVVVTVSVKAPLDPQNHRS